MLPLLLSLLLLLLLLYLPFEQDPEPEKLEVPPEMLKNVFYAASDVLQLASRSTGAKTKDEPAARRRWVYPPPYSFLACFFISIFFPTPSHP